MSTTIQSCPGCKSLILSDTYECPECGCVLDQKKKDAANARIASDLKNANMTEECPHCREQVRIGLVRCWKCGGFMRDDIAKQYQNMTASPQQIIYSDVPPDERTDFIPARDGSGAQEFRPNVFDADDDFSLDDETQISSDAAGRDFELDGPTNTASRTALPAGADPVAALADAAPAPAPAADSPDKPQSETPGDSAGTAKRDTDQDAGKAEEQKTSGDAAAADSGSGKPAAGADELLSIAMQEQKEDRKRRQARKAEERAKQMLVPCRCGAWIRVHERQAGKTVRCRQCKRPMAIPDFRRKTEKKVETEAPKSIQINWIEGVWFHILTPTELVLKPGSLADDHTLADLGFTDDRLFILRQTSAGKKKKKGFFGGGRSTDDDGTAWREAARKHIATSGFENVPNSEVHLIEGGRAAELKLVQPIAKVQESMFAGIPVFGEGRIAVFLPTDLPDGQQAFCSFTLTAYGLFEEKVKETFDVTLPGEDNGVPQGVKHETLSCHYSQAKIEAVKDLPYYQQDPAFELPLVGYRCVNCQIAVSEEARQKNKLGGANGKAIAKAKCPKCGARFGDEPLYKAVRKSSPAAEAE
jgi:hypothetical protein